MDGNGVWRFPEGSGRQGRMERYCFNVIYCARRPPRLRGWNEMRWYNVKPSRYGIFVDLDNFRFKNNKIKYYRDGHYTILVLSKVWNWPAYYNVFIWFQNICHFSWFEYLVCIQKENCPSTAVCFCCKVGLWMSLGSSNLKFITKDHLHENRMSSCN